MKLVYIAGPYGDRGGYEAIEKNIDRAREAAVWCAENGIAYFCPHLNSAHFEVLVPDVSVEFWYALDIEVLKRCDAMFLVEGWEKSKGVAAEMLQLDADNKPFFRPDERDLLLKWARA